MSKEVAGSTQVIKDTDMSQIEKSFLFDGMTLPTSIYLRLKNDTYIVIGKKGDKAQISTMKGYQHDNFHLYVRNVEKPLLTMFITRLTETTIDNPGISLDKKSEFVLGLLEDSFQELEKSSFSTLGKMKSVGNLLVKLSKQVTTLEKALEIMENQKEQDSRHAMATCMISLMIAEEAQQLTNLNQEKLVTAALLHDVGMRYLPEAIREKSPHQWSPEELKIYESHAQKGAEMLRQVEGMSVEVLLVVAEHHENSIGTGFPKRIRDVKMNPLSKIVALADCVADLLLNEKGPKYTADQAVQYIEEVLGQPYNKALFLALKNIVNVTHLDLHIKKIS